MLAELVSKCSIKFEMMSVMVCLREKILSRSNITFKKDTEKVTLLNRKA